MGAVETGTGLGAGFAAAWARLGAVTGADLGARVGIFLGGGGVLFGGEDFTDADAVAFFLSTEAVRAAEGADLAGDWVTGFSSQRVYTARVRNERRFGTTAFRSL